MELIELLADLRLNRDFMANVVAWERLRPRPPRTAPLDISLDVRIAAALHARGIDNFYSHQAAAITAVSHGQNVIIATATASGKSLCYTVPVLQRLLARPSARALYLFPTKALAHDQLAETTAIIQGGALSIPAHSYDGDTARSRRQKIRQNSRILISNPDMLHAGILPTHTNWRELFANLEFVVLDEIHAYRGVFGSHIANVLRRLQRICRFYGSAPQFICCSATIANPREHAERLVEQPFTLVDEAQNGAPTGEKQFILYNPPIIDAELGLRASTMMAARDAALAFLQQNIQTIVFARARNTVELLLSYLQDDLGNTESQAKNAAGEAIQPFAAGVTGFPAGVTGYRGGYLPHERREIEQGLRSGALRGVVATNALELGIDIGELDAAIITGYPGSIASVWQQAGRAGRRAAHSVALLIAGNNLLDQYICTHPRYLFGQSPEHALTNPDNLRIMARHLLCAAYELPWQQGEPFGRYGPVDELLEILQHEGVLHQSRQQYYWLGDASPATAVSLRTSSDDTVVIQDVDTPGSPAVIGEIDLEAAAIMVYEDAIYMHQARTYLVERLDWHGRIAYARPVDVDYYTRASVGSSLRNLRPETEAAAGGVWRAFGDVTVVTKASGYRKIKRYSHETLGFGLIDLPELVLETSGYWLVFSEELAEQLYNAGILLRPNDYGPNWQAMRRLALERDGSRCRLCGAGGEEQELADAGKPARSVILHVHHIRPFREFNYLPGQNENYREANKPENLITLCPGCHRQAEAGQPARSALGGLAYVLRNLAPLYLMCDPGDIEVVAESRSPLTQAPTIVVYERVAGVGFSQRLFELHDDLLAAAQELVADCRCRDGCPACIGPPGEIGPDTKVVTRRLLKLLTHQ